MKLGQHAMPMQRPIVGSARRRSRHLTLAILFGACGGRPIGPLAPIPMDDYVSTLVHRNCARSVACDQMPDMVTCLATTPVDLSAFFDAVSAGKMTYDGAAAAECFAATSLASVACTMTAQRAVPNDPSCAHIFNGTQAEGDPCNQTDECASANCNLNVLTDCTGTPVCCEGTCAPATPARLPIGADCSAAGPSCVSDAFCSASTGLCVASAAVGQPCDTTDRFCGIGLTCGKAASGSQQVCLALPAEGQACAALSDCDALNDYCDPGTQKCVRNIAVGAACPYGVGCVDYAQCDGRTSKCVENGNVGEGCPPGGPFCLGELQCMAGVCALPAAVQTCPP